MAVRVLYYLAIAYHGLVRAQGSSPAGAPPAASSDAGGDDLQRSGSLDAPRRRVRPDRAGTGLARRTPAEAAVTKFLTSGRWPATIHGGGTWCRGSRAWSSDPSPDNVLRVVRNVREAYPGPEHARLRQAFREWILGAAESWGIGEEDLAKVKSMEEAGMIYHAIEELKEQYRRAEEAGSH